MCTNLFGRCTKIGLTTYLFRMMHIVKIRGGKNMNKWNIRQFFYWCEKNKHKISSIGIAIIVVVMAFCFVHTEEATKMDIRDMVIAIDPGHGGFDPGKVGVTETLEKDINLGIANKVKRKLEKKGINVVMTRTKDQALCSDGDTSKKTVDMQNRVNLINESKAVLAVSIHQNSFTDSSVKGAQVFYYSASEEGKKLAGFIQTGLKNVIQDDNHRMEKANEDYYLLRKVTCPIVIVECGFLSNEMEEALLCEEDYQEKVAKGIVSGIVEYLK